MAAASLANSGWYSLIGHFERFSLKNVVFGGIIIFTGGCLLFALPFHFALHLGFFIFLTSFPNMIFVFTDTHLDQNVPSHIRASLISIQSLVNALFIGAAYIGLGQMIDHSILGPKALACLSVPPLLGMILLSFYFVKTARAKDVQKV